MSSELHPPAAKHLIWIGTALLVGGAVCFALAIFVFKPITVQGEQPSVAGAIVVTDIVDAHAGEPDQNEATAIPQATEPQAPPLISDTGSGIMITTTPQAIIQTIDSQLPRTDTSIRVQAGDIVYIQQLDGEWRSGEGEQWPPVNLVGDTRVDGDPDFPLPDENLMALIGGVGEGQLFAVHNAQPLHIETDGELWLGPNDDDLTDNSGQIQVGIIYHTTLIVRATAVPTPVAAADLVAGSLLQSEATPEPLPLSTLTGLGFITFVSYPSGPTEIHIINADGTGERFIQQGQSPDVSPDGQYIAFEDVRDFPDLFLIQFDGTNQEQLTINPEKDFNPIWSPNGSEILFFSERNPGGEYIINLETREERRESANWTRFSPPTGPYIGWDLNICRTQDENGVARINLCLESGEQSVNITQNKLPFNVSISTNPWSPDGRYVVFDDLFNIYVMEVETGRYVQLPVDGRGRDAHWSPDRLDGP